MKPLQHYWYNPPDFYYLLMLPLLLPLALLYCAVTIIRRKLYLFKILKSYRSRVPLVVVGNIVAGGSGKTPLLISLCEYVQQHGYRPGVVSRGYGGSVNGIKQVSDKDTAEVVGDEPLMIFEHTNVPVVVGADRVGAVNYLLEHNHCDIIFSDDGLQHYRMQRDFEIAVVDAGRRFGNGLCLPAGPLREGVSRLKDVNLLVYNGQDSQASGQSYYQLEISGIRKVDSSTIDTGAVNNEIPDWQTLFANKPVHAVAGIGYPERFFRQLRQNGLDIIEHAFPDHHDYQQRDFSGWETGCIIMTEKDAVKCRQLSLPDAWVVTVKAVYSDELEARLSADLLPIINRD